MTSLKFLKLVLSALQSDYKKLHITGIIDNYENGLEFVKNYDDMKNLIVFLGSSFGNFDPENGIKFLQKINSSMKKGDLFLVGLDLVKDKDVLCIRRIMTHKELRHNSTSMF